MPFLVECGKTDQHKSWAYSGVAVRMSGAHPVFPECAFAFQTVAMGLVFFVCVAQKGCHCPVLFMARAVLPRMVWSSRVGSSSPGVCQPGKTSSQPLNSSRPFHHALLASERINNQFLRTNFLLMAHSLINVGHWPIVLFYFLTFFLITPRLWHQYF